MNIYDELEKLKKEADKQYRRMKRYEAEMGEITLAKEIELTHIRSLRREIEGLRREAVEMARERDTLDHAVKMKLEWCEKHGVIFAK